MADGLANGWRARMFGTPLRAITSLTLAVDMALIAVALFVLFGSDRESLFRIDARTDSAEFVANTDMRWGQVPITLRESAGENCDEAGLVVPRGAAISARRGAEGYAVQVEAAAENAITLVCGPDDNRSVAFVEARFGGAERAAAEGLSALPISGTLLRIGGSPDPDSPVTTTKLLRSGTLVSEARSWPFDSARIAETRQLNPGEIVSLDEPPHPGAAQPSAGQPVAFDGLLIFDQEGARILTRSAGTAAYVTEVNAPAGKPAVVAPTRLARLQAQAEWGLWLVIGAVILNIVSTLRAHLADKDRPFAWAVQSARSNPPPSPAPAAKPAARRSGQARKARKSGSTTGTARAVAAVTAALAAARPDPAFAQQLADHAVFRIEGPSGVGQGFAIANPRGTSKCLIVTVSHVVQPGDAVELVGEVPNTASGQAAALRAKARYLDELAPGLIVLEPLDNTPLGACAPLTQPARADDLFESDKVGRMSYVDPSGYRRSLRLLIDGDPRLNRLLEATLVAASQVGPGNSGSAVSVDGRILALADNVIDGVTRLTRLDNARLNPDYLSASRPQTTLAGAKSSGATQPLASWLPFDFDRLPQPYREAAIAANNAAKEAENMQKAARQNAILAEDAAAKARLKTPGYGNGNVTEDDRFYEGQVGQDGIANGWGILRFLKGAAAGEEYRGYFQRTKSSNGFSGTGPTVYSFGLAGARNDHVKWEGLFDQGKMNGPGVLTFRNGDASWSKWAGGLVNSPGMFGRASDGARFFVTYKNGRFSGPGVLYNKEGQPTCICVWEDGNVVKDETAAVLAAK